MQVLIPAKSLELFDFWEVSRITIRGYEFQEDPALVVSLYRYFPYEVLFLPFLSVHAFFSICFSVGSGKSLDEWSLSFFVSYRDSIIFVKYTVDLEFSQGSDRQSRYLKARDCY